MKLQLLSHSIRTGDRQPGGVLMRLASVVVVAGTAAALALPSAAHAQASAAPATATPSPALTYKSVREGTGASPTATDAVRVNYRGTLMDGTEFDSSYKRNEPATFPLNRVIPCWTQGVQRMKVGGKAELVCPPELAYGERGAGGMIPPNATLRFEIELLAIIPR
jgi:FKBP-type peptidyl-prolyl cis-trans isomerase FkpA